MDAIRPRSEPDSITGRDPKEDPMALNAIPTAHASHDEHAANQDSQAAPSSSFELHRTTSDMRTTRSRLGLQPQASIVEEHDLAEQQDWWWAKVRIALREPFAEFFGTMILVLFGDGAVAQVLLSTGQKTAPGGDGFGNYQSINWGWALGVMLGIYVAGQSLSGRLVEGPGLRTVPPSPTATAGIFCTYPQAFDTTSPQFADEFLASAILMFVIYALKDDSNKGQFSASGAWFPLAMFFLIFGIGACFGWQTGYAINLARDFGPRLMSYAVGYGGEVWSAGGYYFWVPIVAPFCGCLFGGILYDVFLYTGPDSLVNQPWFGLKDLARPKAAILERMEKHKAEGLV
ncbi:glycerol channel [Friedmanniomyces endolithicus]|nr:glycerol channel [Friedmanniomyces endolithicus]KAK1818513.1 glycerol channel [Friedmanniomyces endolithicus]